MSWSALRRRIVYRLDVNVMVEVKPRDIRRHTHQRQGHHSWAII